MSNIPNLGEYGYVAPVTPSTPLIETNLPTTNSSGRFWRWLLLALLVGIFVYGVVKLIMVYRSKRDKKKGRT